ncbi:cytosolic factor, phosphatidylinositol/phosphatidylcholine transfer protein [Rhizophlyctis rosea]|nr:cytosolic factor, phosphatidylinositol/phosphatidylcholine transfer protein [Rhizophlyctis rosea]
MSTDKLPTAGRLGHLTPDEEKTLAQFKEELKAEEPLYDPSKHDDNTLLRFLRARKFQLPAAKKMFTDFLAWRKEFGTDTILQDFDFPEYPVVQKYYPRFYHKVDKLGRPVYIEQLGNVDPKQLWQVTTPERMLKNHVYGYEKLVQYRLPACSKATHTQIEQSCTILDLKGVYLSQFSNVYSMVKQVSSIAQNYYPEMLGKMYIINAPMLFTTCWGLVKPLLDEVTVSKINILGGSYKSKLLETIDEGCLPKFLGGSCECPGGCDVADVGPWNDGTVEGYPIEEFEKFPKPEIPQKRPSFYQRIHNRFITASGIHKPPRAIDYHMADAHVADVEMTDAQPLTVKIEKNAPAGDEVANGSSVKEEPVDEEDLADIIQDGNWAILQMASERSKVIQLKTNTTVNMGKFGTFQVNDVIGKPFDIPMEVYDRGRARPVTNFTNIEAFDIETDETNNNRDIVDDRTSQQLSYTDIEELKKKSLKGDVDSETVIKKIVENSKTFEMKTEFSKAKYIKKKEKKFSKVFTLRKPTARTLCMHYYKTEPIKTREMRVDTLAQMLTLGNIRAGAKVLVADDFGGLVMAGLLERMQGMGTIMAFHDHETYNGDLSRYLNLPASECVQPFPWARIIKNEDESLDAMNPRGDDEKKMQQRRERFQKKIEKLAKLRKSLTDGGWDGLFAATHFNAKQLIETLYPFLAGGRPLVLYAQQKELLHEAFHHMRTSRSFINVQITEGWLREYQVPVDAVGGTHPLMRMPANGGYLLSGLKVLDCPVVAASARTGGEKGKGGKRGGEGFEGGRRKKRRGGRDGEGEEGEGEGGDGGGEDDGMGMGPE